MDSTKEAGYVVEMGTSRFHIPRYMMPGIKRYVNDGCRPGGFLTAVLENDLVKAARWADGQNIQNLPAYASYLHNEMPSNAWGSPEKVEAWMRKKRIIALEKEGRE